MKKILLAEDEDHIARLIHFKLSKEGHDVTIARNGKEAIDSLKTKKWDLIILDVMMPIFDGWEVLKNVRSDSEIKNLPVLMLTAKGQQKDKVNAVQLGATDYLKKPFDPNELAQVVKKLTGGEV